VRGKRNKPSHKISNIKGTLIQVCNIRMKHITIISFIKRIYYLIIC
jgi:hypothetical protein